jgi:translation initiation factor IF-3
VPVPRRFDRRPPERDTTRINERIRVPEVRLIGEDGSQIGVLKIDAALRYAQARDLDLVEVAPEAKPPVCRVLDYSKYKYEQAQKLKQARKHQQQITIREIKFRPKIAQHDYDTKKGHVERFLKHKDKVKVTIMFRGREVTHPERGVMILDRLAEELAELAIVEQRPIQDGRNMTMMLGPSKAVLAGQFADSKHADPADPSGADPAAALADGAGPAVAVADGAGPAVAVADGAGPVAALSGGAAPATAVAGVAAGSAASTGSAAAAVVADRPGSTPKSPADVPSPIVAESAEPSVNGSAAEAATVPAGEPAAATAPPPVKPPASRRTPKPTPADPAVPAAAREPVSVSAAASGSGTKRS